ncbi:MAG: hypothetical protein KME54_09915 [Tolypothrix brevis GSE-NOS-MK-07-07A]|nr:hypothetical protein [Tolypothrix brevis GSE-NOS-MK-07-07A]
MTRRTLPRKGVYSAAMRTGQIVHSGNCPTESTLQKYAELSSLKAVAASKIFKAVLTA